MNPIVDGYFQAAAEDLAAVQQLLKPVPRASAFHLQQAAGKLVKAVLAAEGLHPPPDHNIGRLVSTLPDGHEWKADLMELDYLSRYATSFRYPSPTGKMASAPERAVLDRYLKLVETLTAAARDWCHDRE